MQRRVADVTIGRQQIVAGNAELGQRIAELQVAESAEAAGGGTEYVGRTRSPLLCASTYYMVV